MNLNVAHFFQERNENYVVEIEVYLSRELNYNPMEDEVDDSLWVY